MLSLMTRRNSDEVSLDIVTALLVGVPIGIVLALVVGGIGWASGRDLSDLAGWFGVAGAGIAVAVALRRIERSGRHEPERSDARSVGPAQKPCWNFAAVPIASAIKQPQHTKTMTSSHIAAVA